MKYVLTVVFHLLFICSSIAKVDVYPAPDGILSSDNYSVRVEQAGNKFDSFVYYSSPLDNDADNAEDVRHEVIRGINENDVLRDFYFNGKEKALDSPQSVSWSCFSFDGEINIVIDSKKQVHSFKILPSSAGIDAQVKGSEISFTIDNPQKLAVVVNNDYLNPLFLFADAPENNLPDVDAPGTLVVNKGDDIDEIKKRSKNASVLYFMPGVHNIGVAFEVYSNQTIYISGGAYLLGTIHGMMATNVTIRGRGILAGDRISRSEVKALKRANGFQKRVYERMKYHAINMLSDQNYKEWNAYADYQGHGCDNLTIEGITIASPRQFFIRATGVPMTIHNVKMVGAWPYNTDGISTIGQANTTVFDCFFHCNDDAIYVSPNDCHIHHNVFWQGNNGCVFQFSWGGAPKNQGGAYIHDCDVLHCGHVSQANNRMIIGSRKSRGGDIGHVHFKDIRVEGPVWSLFRLETNGAGDLGTLHDITMENISVNGPVIHKSNIISSKGRSEGEASTSWIRNITLKNVTINGTLIDDDDIVIGDFQVENVNILK